MLRPENNMLSMDVSFNIIQNQMKYISLCLLLVIIHTSLVTANISDPTFIEITPNLVSVKANVTLPVTLPAPDTLTSVVSVQIKEGSQYCKLAEVKPSYSISTILQLEGITDRVTNGSWNVQIMTFAWDPKTSKLYTLLDNGTILVTQFPLDKTEYFKSIPIKSYTFQSVGNTETWLTSKHKIFVLGNSLYVLKDQTLANLYLYQGGYWNVGNPIMKGVLKIQIIADKIHALTNHQFSCLDEKGNLSFNITGGAKYVDFYVSGANLFILDAETGIIGRNFQQASVNNTFVLPQLGNVVKIRGYGSTLFAIYEIEHRNYLAEYFIISKSLVLNRYYHNYYVIKDIHAGPNYAVIDAYNQFILLHHSINRRSFQTLTPVEHLYKSYGVKVINIMLVNQLQANFSMIIGLKSDIFKLTFPAHKYIDFLTDNYGINSQFVQCSSNQSDSVQVHVVYKGVCSARVHQSSSYACTAHIYNQVSFEYSHEVRSLQHSQKRFIFSLIFLVVALLSVLLILIARRRLKNKQEELERWRKSLSEKKEQNSMKHQGTFNLDVPNK